MTNPNPPAGATWPTVGDLVAEYSARNPTGTTLRRVTRITTTQVVVGDGPTARRYRRDTLRLVGDHYRLRLERPDNPVVRAALTAAGLHNLAYRVDLIERSTRDKGGPAALDAIRQIGELAANTFAKHAETAPTATMPAVDPADPRQAAYNAVFAHIRDLGDTMPGDPVHRNAMIWRAVYAALAALTPDNPE